MKRKVRTSSKNLQLKPSWRFVPLPKKISYSLGFWKVQNSQWSLLFQPDFVEVVRRHILETKAHTTPAHREDNPSNITDLHYLLDFDMAVLSWPHNGWFHTGNNLKVMTLPQKSLLKNKHSLFALCFRLPAEYDKYAEQIRQEYIHVPDEEFNKRRAEVCSSPECVFMCTLRTLFTQILPSPTGPSSHPICLKVSHSRKICATDAQPKQRFRIFFLAGLAYVLQDSSHLRHPRVQKEVRRSSARKPRERNHSFDWQIVFFSRRATYIRGFWAALLHFTQITTAFLVAFLRGVSMATCFQQLCERCEKETTLPAHEQRKRRKGNF